ncbi:putative FANCI solenoid 1 [Blattamonas nauphoetae]|uniref:FANCI solenoid 1 n=1 Tax=Blattamonas nauphoetae TaxID=2049346 RepID=A0ABQ9XMK3_9EUKA|nr:putative FANCI solenoid 1 [Blattamonas nauphoetae]
MLIDEKPFTVNDLYHAFDDSTSYGEQEVILTRMVKLFVSGEIGSQQTTIRELCDYLQLNLHTLHTDALVRLGLTIVSELQHASSSSKTEIVNLLPQIVSLCSEFPQIETRGVSFSGNEFASLILKAFCKFKTAPIQLLISIVSILPDMFLTFDEIKNCVLWCFQILQKSELSDSKQLVSFFYRLFLLHEEGLDVTIIKQTILYFDFLEKRCNEEPKEPSEDTMESALSFSSVVKLEGSVLIQFQMNTMTHQAPAQAVLTLLRKEQSLQTPFSLALVLTLSRNTFYQSTVTAFLTKLLDQTPPTSPSLLPTTTSLSTPTLIRLLPRTPHWDSINDNLVDFFCQHISHTTPSTLSSSNSTFDPPGLATINRTVDLFLTHRNNLSLPSVQTILIDSLTSHPPPPPLVSAVGLAWIFTTHPHAHETIAMRVVTELSVSVNASGTGFVWALTWLMMVAVKPSLIDLTPRSLVTLLRHSSTQNLITTLVESLATLHPHTASITLNTILDVLLSPTIQSPQSQTYSQSPLSISSQSLLPPTTLSALYNRLDLVIRKGLLHRDSSIRHTSLALTVQILKTLLNNPRQSSLLHSPSFPTRLFGDESLSQTFHSFLSRLHRLLASDAFTRLRLFHSLISLIPHFSPNSPLSISTLVSSITPFILSPLSLFFTLLPLPDHTQSFLTLTFEPTINLHFRGRQTERIKSMAIAFANGKSELRVNYDTGRAVNQSMYLQHPLHIHLLAILSLVHSTMAHLFCSDTLFLLLQTPLDPAISFIGLFSNTEHEQPPQQVLTQLWSFLCQLSTRFRHSTIDDIRAGAIRTAGRHNTEAGEDDSGQGTEIEKTVLMEAAECCDVLIAHCLLTLHQQSLLQTQTPMRSGIHERNEEGTFSKVTPAETSKLFAEAASNHFGSHSIEGCLEAIFTLHHGLLREAKKLPSRRQNLAPPNSDESKRSRGRSRASESEDILNPDFAALPTLPLEACFAFAELYIAHIAQPVTNNDETTNTGILLYENQQLLTHIFFSAAHHIRLIQKRCHPHVDTIRAQTVALTASLSLSLQVSSHLASISHRGSSALLSVFEWVDSTITAAYDLFAPSVDQKKRVVHLDQKRSADLSTSLDSITIEDTAAIELEQKEALFCVLLSSSPESLSFSRDVITNGINGIDSENTDLEISNGDLIKRRIMNTNKRLLSQILSSPHLCLSTDQNEAERAFNTDNDDENDDVGPIVKQKRGKVSGSDPSLQNPQKRAVSTFTTPGDEEKEKPKSDSERDQLIAILRNDFSKQRSKQDNGPIAIEPSQNETMLPESLFDSVVDSAMLVESEPISTQLRPAPFTLRPSDPPPTSGASSDLQKKQVLLTEFNVIHSIRQGAIQSKQLDKLIVEGTSELIRIIVSQVHSLVLLPDLSCVSFLLDLAERVLIPHLLGEEILSTNHAESTKAILNLSEEKRRALGEAHASDEEILKEEWQKIGTRVLRTNLLCHFGSGSLAPFNSLTVSLHIAYHIIRKGHPPHSSAIRSLSMARTQSTQNPGQPIQDPLFVDDPLSGETYSDMICSDAVVPTVMMSIHLCSELVQQLTDSIGLRMKEVSFISTPAAITSQDTPEVLSLPSLQCSISSLRTSLVHFTHLCGPISSLIQTITLNFIPIQRSLQLLLSFLKLVHSLIKWFSSSTSKQNLLFRVAVLHPLPLHTSSTSQPTSNATTTLLEIFLSFLFVCGDRVFSILNPYFNLPIRNEKTTQTETALFSQLILFGEQVRGGVQDLNEKLRGWMKREEEREIEERVVKEEDSGMGDSPTHSSLLHHRTEQTDWDKLQHTLEDIERAYPPLRTRDFRIEGDRTMVELRPKIGEVARSASERSTTQGKTQQNHSEENRSVTQRAPPEKAKRVISADDSDSSSDEKPSHTAPKTARVNRMIMSDDDEPVFVTPQPVQKRSGSKESKGKTQRAANSTSQVDASQTKKHLKSPSDKTDLSNCHVIPTPTAPHPTPPVGDVSPQDTQQDYVESPISSAQPRQSAEAKRALGVRSIRVSSLTSPSSRASTQIMSPQTNQIRANPLSAKGSDGQKVPRRTGLSKKAG